MLRTVIPVVLLVLPLAACTGDAQPTEGASGGASESGSSEGVSPEVREGLVALYAGDHPRAQDTADGECFADALLERIAPGELEEVGVVVDGAVVTDLPLLEPETAGDWIGATFACVDYFEESARAQVAVTKGTVDWREYAACLREEIDLEVVRAALVAALGGDWDSDAVAALSRAQAECSTAANPG
ncbi:hypothetical protein QWY28_09880 [Nocardioides sp. SOB77]|uniref:DUF732 domain-containing protein n=1 Tax=Nocardioides oceani TaxID=3058369 RepID=A0ABT8FFR4_9ACTN|nr:hypothetical protein [Nocardioides oceani]MDN4173250.1 hypothetical protein [Nocardioides oceani]